MKPLVLTTIAAVVLVGCGESQQSVPVPEAKPVAEAATPEPTTVKAPDISIHQAAKDGNIEAVKQHLAAGTDVNAKDKYGDNSLNLSARVGHKIIVKLLIADGADVNIKDENGFTPLHSSASSGHDEIVELLIANGADVNAKEEEGQTPLDWAIRLNKTKTIVLLRKHGGKHGTIHGAALGDDIEAVKEFLAAGADVNVKDVFFRQTPLHNAAAEDHNEIAELLVAGGADVNAKGTIGVTPLDMADGETADLLRKHGGKTSEELKAEGN